MAYVTIPGLVYPPSPLLSANTTAIRFVSLNTIDADGEGDAISFMSPKDGTIDKIAARFNSVSTSGDVDFRLETLNVASEFLEPSGTLATTNSNKVDTISATGWHTATLTASHTTTAGEELAAVVVRDTASTFVGDTSQNDRSSWYLGTAGGVWPHMHKDISGAWASDNETGINIMVGYSDGTWAFIPNASPADATGTVNANSAALEEIGRKFQVPFDFRAWGVVINADMESDFVCRLRADGTPGTSLAVTPTIREETSGTGYGGQYFPFTTPYEASADTTYRVVIDAGSGNSPVQYFEVAATANYETIYGDADETKIGHWTEYNGSAWTDTTDRQPPIAIVIDQIQVGAALISIAIYPWATTMGYGI